MGKSKPQDALAAKIRECFPQAHVSQENYIIDLIEECGFTENEIRRELGHAPHRMFVDIVLRDSDQTVAFEYHGEQHYSLVGNMTKTDADLLLNQQLDQEKSWILSRIGIPLVAVPYDKYIDESVLYAEIDAAAANVAEDARGYSPCGECQRLFPPNQLAYGVCRSCEERLAEEGADEEDGDSPFDAFSGYDPDCAGEEPERGTPEYRKAQKEKARAMRKAAREAYKSTPEYAKHKEEQKAREKARRKEENRRRKEENRAARQAARRAQKEGLGD